MTNVKNTRLLPQRKKSKFEKIKFSFSVCLFLFFFLVPMNAGASLGGYECYDLYQDITNEAVETNKLMNLALDFAQTSPFEIIEKVTANQTTVTNLKTASNALAITIATLLLCIDFFKKSVNFEWSRSWENILLFLVKVIVIKVMVQNSDNIIESVYQAFQYLNDKVSVTGDFEFIPVGEIQTYTIEHPANEGDLLSWVAYWFGGGVKIDYTYSVKAVNFLHPEWVLPPEGSYTVEKFTDALIPNNSLKIIPLVTLILDQIYFLVMKAVACLVFVQVIGRAFELTVYTLLAPLPLATFASEVNCDIAKNFLKKYIACILQVTVIIVMFLAYQGLKVVIEDNPDLSGSTLIGIVTFITLGLGVMKSGQWARNICGTA